MNDCSLSLFYSAYVSDYKDEFIKNMELAYVDQSREKEKLKIYKDLKLKQSQ